MWNGHAQRRLDFRPCGGPRHRAGDRSDRLARLTAPPTPPNLAAFDEVWETVRDRFYDPRLHGLDWQAARAQFRPRVVAAGSREETAAAVNAMLAELGASHTQYYTPEDPAYYQLADIFSYALRHRGLERVFPTGEVSYPGIGVHAGRRSGPNLCNRVIEGAPAHQAGLLVGDEISLSPTARFGPSTRSVARSRRRLAADPAGAAGRPAAISVTPSELHPNAMFLRGLQASARILAGGNNARIGYVHVWSYAGGRYQAALEDLIADGPLRDADALVWDLRGGWGGAQPEYLDLFNPRAPTLQTTDRDGKTGMVDVKWRKPVATLINGGTRSGKEVLAYGFKEYRLGELCRVCGTEGARARGHSRS